MKFSLVTVSCSLCLFAGVAAAEDSVNLTRYGVDVDSTEGWYDANKTPENDIDDNMCYAASAANLVTWWQDWRKQNGYSLPEGVPDTLEDVWNRYRNSLNEEYKDQGGLSPAAINWWISGVYLPANESEANYSIFGLEESAGVDISFDRSYDYRYNVTSTELEDFFDIIYDCKLDNDDEAPLKGGIFKDLLEDGAGVSLAISSDVGGLAHAITLCGAEYEDDVLKTIWVTDSDDGVESLVAVPVSEIVEVKTDAEDRVKIYLDLYTKEEGYNYEGVYINQIYAIDPEVTSGWSLIPEPSSAVLPIMALSVLLVRRRRK